MGLPVTGLGVELVYTAGSSDKYWRVVQVGNTVATHYGRRGAAGSVTVHHLPTMYAAREKYYSLRDAKMNKGYRVSGKLHTIAVTVPHGLLTHAASTGATGNGGTNPNLAYALMAYWIEAAKKTGDVLKAQDPLFTKIDSGEITAHQVAVGALLGYRFDSSDLKEMSAEQLEILAAITSDDVTPADVTC